MPLILPNTLGNEIPADGDKLQQNFATIQDWANQDAVTSDGSTGMNAPLLLPGAPTQPNQAATKAYVDGSIPVGVMWEYAGDTAPDSWMLCRGQAISRATYAALFAVIGTRFGAGDNTTTFNLPSMQGRSPMGHWPGGVWAPTIGAFIGDANSTLPSHNHTGPNHLHSFSGGTAGANARHVHQMPPIQLIQSTAAPTFYTHVTGGGGFDIASTIFDLSALNSQADSPDHAHAFSGTTAGADRDLSTGTAGGSPTNTNIGPGVVLNFIIRVS